jgi:hypothetical protein
MSDENTTLLPPGTWVQQGPATLVVREAGWAVMVPGLKKHVIEAAWTVLGKAPQAEDFLDQLVAEAELESTDKLTAILFGLVDGTTVTYGVKGKTPLSVYTADGAQQIAGTDDEPFVIKKVEGVRRTAFGELPAEDPVGLPRVAVGIARARGFVHVTVDPAELDEDARKALMEQVEADGRSIEDPETKQRKKDKPPPAPRPKPGSAPARKPMLATRKPGEMPPSLQGRGRGAASFSTRNEEPAEPAGPSVFDDLFGDKPAAPAPATPPAAAAAPDPAPAPAAEATPAAAPAEAAAPPAPAAPVTGAAAAAATAGDTGTSESGGPSSGRRRLVSTSLFDRRRASRTAPEGTRAPTETEAPAAPAAAAPPAPAPAAPVPEAQPSIPTPVPPDEDDGSSPVTLVAPIDDGEQEQEAEAVGADPTPRSEVHQGVVSSTTAITATAGSSAIGDLEGSSDYDDLFGKTVFRRIEDAAVRKKEDGEEEGEENSAEEESTPVEETSVPEPEDEPDSEHQDPAAFAAPAPSATASVGEFIDWVPGVGREAPEIAQTAARRAAAPPAAPAPAYPQVHMPQRPPAPQQPPQPQHPFPPQHPQSGNMPSGAPYPGQPQAPQNQPAQNHPAQNNPAQHHSGQHHPAQAPHPGMPMSPGSAGPAPSGRHANTPHPVGPAAPPQMPPPGTGPGPAPAGPSAAPAAGAHGGRPGNAVMVPALLCPQGHANSPEHSQCRSCGAPLGGQTFTVPRPVLGIVDISTGETITLNRSAIIGRRPRASRVSGNDVPQLITVPSPQQDISRSHLELQLEGWHVVASDLGTTNGTTLYREGMEPLRLRPREGVVLHRGDQLDLGDGIRLRMREAQ